MDTLAIKSGRGFGKKALAQAYIESQSGELVPIGVVDTGFSLGPVDAETGEVHKVQNFETEMTFTTEFVAPLEIWEALFPYTPRDELRDRLNDSLQGKQPAPAVNTRYWRGL